MPNIGGYELNDTAIALILSEPRNAETIRFIQQECGGCGLTAALAIYDYLHATQPKDSHERR